MKSKKNNNGLGILIAEDSQTQAEQLGSLLEQHGYRVTIAANGKQALQAARAQKPALVISDIVMPEMDGYGLCKAIKADGKLKDIPVILVTALSDSRDVVMGLECGADNFIRKPYDERYLLSRIEYLLMNLELRKNQKMQMGVEIKLGEQKHFITAERQQILDLLISTYEQAIHINEDLKAREKELAHSNQVLNGLYHIAEGLNRVTSEQEAVESALQRALLELPGIQAGWISLLDGAGFRLAAASNLPPALEVSGAMEGDCQCRRRLLSGDFEHATNIMECERLAKAKGDTRGLRYHVSVPLWLGDRTLGMMNLVGPEEGLFDEAELKVLDNVGNQVAIALERARLHQHLEKLVEERTAKLTAEIAERKRIEREQARLVAIVEATPDFVATIDIDGHTIFCNQAGLRMLGHEAGQDAPPAIYETHPEWAAKLVREEGIPYAIEHGTWSGETAFLRRDGREIPVSQVIIAHKGSNGKVEYLSTIARDISVLKENEKRIMRLNRVYAVLSGINTTIVRTHNRQELFDEACRIAVEQNRFRMAWIGLLDANGVDVTLVAKAGFEEGYLDKIRLTARDDEPDTCVLAGQALRGKTAVVCNDIDTDPRMARWREQALQRGYRSVVVFPLLVGDKALGLFLLYASETDYFDIEEMRLLTEIAGDISFALDHIEKEERLNYLAYYDELTGLPNHALFYDRLNQFLHVAGENNAIVAVLVIDLERFRAINETLGRHAGDTLLKLVAERLRAGGLDAHHLARTGADCFAMVLDNIWKESDAAHFLERNVMDPMGQPFMVAGNELQIAARAGIAMFPADGADADTLLRNAEAALKKAKFTGDRYSFYTPELNARVVETLTLENKLRRALGQEQFVLHYQPKVSLKDDQIGGLEALIRWNDPDTGLIPPLMFIPLLEETGMILEVGRWALERAMADFRRWRADGLQVPRIAVNVSAIQLRHKDFVGMVERVVNGAEGIADGLEIEITESLIMQDVEANIGKLRAIRDMGVEVAVDDFGTGYSSLSYIAKLPINALKIDVTFIVNMMNSPDDLSIVSAIISLAHSLNLRVVAEGVETEEQKKLLRLLKCDEMQGYYFSPPQPFENIARLLPQRQQP